MKNTIANIYLDKKELDHINIFIPFNDFLHIGKNELTEQQLEYVLYHLGSDSWLRPYLQKAGQNIFDWRRF